MGFPAEVQKFLDVGRYFDAIRICKYRDIDFSEIRREVDDRVEKARGYIDQGRFDEALELFMSVIGAVETVVVMSKLYQPCVPSVHLVTYLCNVHFRGCATPPATRILFNLFVDAQHRPNLLGFIDFAEKAQTRKPTSGRSSTHDLLLMDSQRFVQTFDVDLAVNILKNHGLEAEARSLSKTSDLTSAAVRERLDSKNYNEAATLIFDRYEEPIGHALLMKFGALILKESLTAGRIIEQAATLIWKTMQNPQEELFLNLFWGFPLNLYRFLKSILTDRFTPVLANTLVSLVIPHASGSDLSPFGDPKVANANVAMDLLRDARLRYHSDQILCVCVNARFWKGCCYLLQKSGRLNDAVWMLMKVDAVDELIDLVMSGVILRMIDWIMLFDKYSSADGFQKIASSSSKFEFLGKILENLDGKVPFSRLRDRILENSELADGHLLEKLKFRGDNVLERLEDLKREMDQMNASGKRLGERRLVSDRIPCERCREFLTPPYITFFCGHCYHHHCISGENQPFCFICSSPE
jgi:hypothetical protein